MRTDLDRMKKAAAEHQTKARTRRMSTPAGREAAVREAWTKAQALYADDPEAWWTLKYLPAEPQPELLRQAREGKLQVYSPVAVAQTGIALWLQAGKERIPNTVTPAAEPAKGA